MEELEDLTINIRELRNKLRTMEKFLQGITLGMGVLFIVMVVILVKIVLG